MLPLFTLRAGLASLLTLLLLVLSPQLHAYDLTVAKDGSGNYTTVQAAIDAAPTGRTSVYTIFIKNGKYKEVVTVPSNKPFIQLVGESVGNTVITYNNSAGTLVGGVALGTQNSASVTINATDFSAVNITFENSFGEASSNGQAVAVLVNNDRAAFRNCRFLGNQDTLYVKGSGTPRHYFLNCYIEGNTDFIFGSSIALFEQCNLYAKVKATATTSYIAVPNTPAGQAFGLVFKNCNVTGNPVANGTNTRYDLGRPWQANPKAAFLNCNLSTPLILDEGWSPTSSAGTATIADSYFVEYQNTHFNGKPINTASRVLSGQNLTPAQPSSQLTATEAATYTKANILSGWDPCTLIDCATPFTKTVIVNNFKGVKGTASPAVPTAFTWNTSWPNAGDVLSVYRATATPPAALGAFAVVGSQTEPSDTIFNYTFSDAVPTSGSLSKYFVRGSATPAQISSDTVTISSAPTIVVTGTLGGFTQQLGSPSSAQSVTVSGTDLTSAVSVTAPANYEVSLTSGGTYSSSVSLAPTGGTLAGTPVYIRLNAATANSYAGNVTLASTNATSVILAVSGTAIVAPTTFSVVLQQWPLRANSADSTFARNARLAATVPTLKRLYLSNGTTLPSVPAYSNLFGQAFGPTANGDGTWTVVGGTLNRKYYEQFTMTVAAGSTVRVDSLLFNSAFYNTSSNTKMAVVYSLNGFAAPADSTEITGGRGPSGALAFSASGNFNNSFPLLNQTAATTALYRVALSGPSAGNPTGGVTVAGGQTLTVRLYFACGSTGTPRYGMLKNFRIKGDAQAATVGDVTITDGRTLTGAYNTVTVASGAQATLMLPVTVNTALTTATGAMLNTNAQALLGGGSVTIAAGSELRIADAAGISASGATGAVRNTGARTFSPDASYTYNGTVAQTSGNGLPATVRNLTVNNTAPLAADRTLTLSRAVGVAQLARLQSGNLLTNGNAFTLLSVAGQGTALLDNTGGVVNGTGTLQRAIDVSTAANIGYHHYSAPVSNTTVADLAAPGFTPVVNSVYNSARLAKQVNPFPTVYGYNEARVTAGTGASSIATDLIDFDKGWFSPNDLTDPMSVGKGYTVNAPNATLVDFVGTFNNGGYNINNLTRGTDAAAGWQLVGNPYPAPLDWSTVTTAQLTNLDAAMYIYHSSGQYVGSYTTYLPNGTGTGGSGTGSPIIDAGAGFFVRVSTPGTGAFTLSNANRVKTFGTQPAFGRAAASTRPLLRLQLAGAGFADDAFLYFDNQATSGVDAAFDATKLTNPNGLNLASLTGTEMLAIDGRPLPTVATMVPLFVGVPAAGTYTLTVPTLDNFGSMTATLHDALTGTRTALSTGSRYAFTLASTTAAGRFTLEFGPAAAPLATAAQVLAAQVQLFPNPASGAFRLQLPVLSSKVAVPATLVNALGQTVRSRTLSAPAGQALDAEFDVRGLAAGVYTLRLSLNGTPVVRKVVVQ
ncbi:pectinesterase family protein [Hymenobacter ruricola]|uniref:T9SS type A sorting domain-containing protein n=1 Tax=Hymenobacter ruricola TaxID=2791023 RepID=A0ABS0I651_9BACT|nr:pectinesterase family protein [Hymenobacter ruricola]MBF9222029.1 T9SS type A sorting domain-containing protein [Hymenobacter ruricola]